MLSVTIYVSLTLNGTLWTDAEITSSQCVNYYTHEFRDSFEKTVTAAEDAIRRHEMCLQTTNIQLVAGAISINTHTNMVFIIITYNLLLELLAF